MPPVIRVSTFYEGASSQDIERRITTPIEKALHTIDGIVETTSLSKEDYSEVYLRLGSARYKQRVYDTVSSRLQAPSLLPQGAGTPHLQFETRTEQPLLRVLLSGAESYQLLHHEATLLKRQLAAIPGVSFIQFDGYLNPEIQVLVNPDLLHYYLISMDDIVTTIQDRAQDQSAGRLAWQNRTQQLSTSHPLLSLSDLESISLTARKTYPYVRLKQLATVQHGFSQRSVLFRRNGLETIRFTVYKTPAADPIRVLHQIQALVEDQRNELQLKTITVSLNDAPSMTLISTFNGLQQTTLLLIVSTFLFVMIFLHPRAGISVAGLIPFTVLTTFSGMAYFSIPLNGVTIAIFLLSLGLGVPIAIEISVQISRQLEKGLSVTDACIAGVTRHLTFLTVLMIIIGLGLASGLIRAPLVMWPVLKMAIVLMIAIALYSIVILPIFLSVLMSKSAKEKRQDLILHTLLLKFHHLLYRRLFALFKARYRFLSLSSLIFFVSLFVFVTQMNHPSPPPILTEDQFRIHLEAPSNVSLDQNARALRKIEKQVSNLPGSELDYFTSIVGRQYRNGQALNGRHYAEISVFLNPESKRNRSSRNIMKALYSDLQSDDPFYEHIDLAPVITDPSPSEIKIRLTGADYKVLENTANRLKSKLEQRSYISRVETPFKPAVSVLKIKPLDHLAASYKLPLSTIDRNVHIAMSGVLLPGLSLEGEDLPIRVILGAPYREQSNYLRDLLIPNQSGLLYKLVYLAQFQAELSYPIRPHYQGTRAITLTLYPNRPSGLTPSRISEIQRIIDTLSKETPAIHIDWVSPDEASIFNTYKTLMALLLALLLISLSIRSYFGRLKNLYLILASYLFVMSGLYLSVVLFRDTVSVGITVGGIGASLLFLYQSITYLSCVQTHVEENPSILKALLESFSQQFRALFISTLSLLLGFLPIVYGVGQTNTHISDFAFSMGWGSLISVLTTLFILPCLMLVSAELSQKERIEIKSK